MRNLLSGERQMLTPLAAQRGGSELSYAIRGG